MRTFGLHTVTVQRNNICELFGDNWDRSMSADAFMVGFHSRLDKTSILDMKDYFKGHPLLKQANLESHDRNLVLGAAGADYALQALVTGLQNAFR